jgi:hypothetical protein
MGNFIIKGCPKLQTLNGLENLRLVQNDFVIEQTNIANLNTLEQLTRVGRDFQIRHNKGFSGFGGWSSNLIIGRRFEIEGNHQLENLDDLHTISTLGGDLIIHNNANLQHSQGLQNIINMQDGLIFSNNPRVKSLDAVDGNNLNRLEIISNDSLVTLSLPNLEKVYHNFKIGHNPQLRDLDQLENLRFVGGDMAIYNNQSLQNIRGIRNINFLEGALIIDSNAILSRCDIQSICNFLTEPDNWYSITGNARGCTSGAEVKITCTANGVDILKLYPNPAHQDVMILGSFFSDTPISVTNTMGQVVIQGILPHNRIIDVSGLDAGVYILRAQVGDEIYTAKFFKEF